MKGIRYSQFKEIKKLNKTYTLKKCMFTLLLACVLLSLKVSYSCAAEPVRMPTKEMTFKKHIIEVYGIDENASEDIFKKNYRVSVIDYKSRLTLYVDANYAIGRTNIKSAQKKLYLFNWF